MTIVQTLQLRKSLSANLVELTRMQNQILSQFNASKYHYASKTFFKFKENEVLWACKITSDNTDSLEPFCHVYIVAGKTADDGGSE